MEFEIRSCEPDTLFGSADFSRPVPRKECVIQSQVTEGFQVVRDDDDTITGTVASSPQHHHSNACTTTNRGGWWSADSTEI